MTDVNSSWLTRQRFLILLALLMLFSGAVRLLIADHRLPDIQVVDENSDLSTALRMLQGELPPRHYRYHRTLTSNVDLVGVTGLLGVAWLRGDVHSLRDFQTLYFTERGQFTLAARLAMTALTVLAIGWVGLTGAYLRPAIGLWAAAALSVNSFFVLNSVYAMPDTLVMAAISLFLWLLMRLWYFRRTRDYVAVGFGFAAVMLAKISAAPIGAAFLLAHGAIVYAQHPRPMAWARRFIFNHQLWITALTVVVFNILLNPVAFFHLDDLAYEINRLFFYAYSDSPISLATRLTTMSTQIQQMIVSIGRWMTPFALLGIGVSLTSFRRSIAAWILLLAGITTFLPVAVVYTINYKIFYWTTWLVPMMLLAGVGLWWLTSQPRLRLIGVVAAVVAFALEGWLTFQTVRVMDSQDTRQAAYEWIAAQWPTDTRVVSGDPLVFSVPLKRNAASIQRALAAGQPMQNQWEWWLAHPEQQARWKTFDLYSFELNTQWKSIAQVKKFLADEKIDYYITADLCSGTPQVGDLQTGSFPPDAAPLMDHLDLVATFSPYTDGSSTCHAPINDRTALVPPDALIGGEQAALGPLIHIYRIK